MSRFITRSLVVPLTVLLCLQSGMAAADENPTISDDDIRRSVAKALPYLADDGRKWMDGRIDMQDDKKCVSCHYVSFGVWSHNAASISGISIDRARTDKLDQDAADFISDPKVGRLVTYAHLLLANPKPNKTRAKRLEKFAERIVTVQEKDGHWQAKGQFPSQARKVVESNAVATMWALAATKRFEKNARVAGSRTRAVKWLQQSKTGVSTEWHAWRLIISALENQPDIATCRERLLALQRDGGGWSWLREKPADAYTTGQVLHALLTTGTPRETAAIQRGIQFLLRSQRKDGTWKVPSVLISAEPDENKDQIYSYWGTSWAVIALSDAIAPTQARATTQQ